MTDIRSGADLASKVASGGTVQLVVDHSEVSYYVEADVDYLESDFQEIHAYLLTHGFVLMDEDECPAEVLQGGGWRVWACHRDGDEFGFARIGKVVSIAAFGIAVAVLPKLEMLLAVAA